VGVFYDAKPKVVGKYATAGVGGYENPVYNGLLAISEGARMDKAHVRRHTELLLVPQGCQSHLVSQGALGVIVKPE